MLRSTLRGVVALAAAVVLALGGASAANAAPDINWTPQTSVTITPSECSADGADVVLDLSVNLVDRETLSVVRVDGAEFSLDPNVVHKASPGTHSYEWWVIKDHDKDGMRILTGAFTVATCGDWTPQTTVTITPSGSSVDGANVALKVLSTVSDGEEITDIQIDGVSVEPENAVAGPGVHTYTYWVRNLTTSDVKSQTGTFTVQHSEETSETPTSNGDKTPSSNGDKTPTGSNGDTLAETGGGAAGGLAAMSALLLAAGATLIMWRRKALQH